MEKLIDPRTITLKELKQSLGDEALPDEPVVDYFGPANPLFEGAGIKEERPTLQQLELATSFGNPIGSGGKLISTNQGINTVKVKAPRQTEMIRALQQAIGTQPRVRTPKIVKSERKRSLCL